MNLSSVSAVLHCITVPPPFQAELEDKIRVLEEKVVRYVRAVGGIESAKDRDCSDPYKKVMINRLL